MGCSPWGRKESGMTERLTLIYSVVLSFSFLLKKSLYLPLCQLHFFSDSYYIISPSVFPNFKSFSYLSHWAFCFFYIVVKCSTDYFIHAAILSPFSSICPECSLAAVCFAC